MSVINLKTLIRSMDWQRGTLPGSSDSELLEAFCDHRSSKAFTDIVDRYGTLVLRVCMRVLGNIHDAEDAFQTTFLIFSRKASTIRNRSSLGSFLHGVACRSAWNLLRTKRRQKNRESWTGLEDLPRYDRDIAWSEVQAALDEEIQMLPSIYREVFVHCCLEGQSRADTARELRVKEGTLSSRLTQAKKLLQVRLSRRGISLSSLLGTLALTMVSASQELRTETTARVMANLAAHTVTRWQASIVTLAQQAHATPFLYHSLSVLAFLAMLAVGTAVSMNSTPSIQVNETHEERVSDPAPNPAGTRLSATGTVVNPEGKPVAGATVYLREWSFMRTAHKRYPFQYQAGQDVLSRMTTDETGQFSFKNIEPPALDEDWLRSRSPYEILIIAPGFAPAWRHLSVPLQKQPLWMQLNRPAHITGVVHDASGKPMASAIVKLLDIGPLRRMFTVDQPGEGYLYLRDSAIRRETQTDTSGKFTLTDLPAGICASIEVTHAGMTDPPILVATSDQPQSEMAAISYSQSEMELKFQPVQISPVTIRLQPRWQLKGKILAEDTGKPLAHLDMYLLLGNRKRSTLTTDAEGVFTTMVAGDTLQGIISTGGKRYPEYLPHWVVSPQQRSESVVLKLPRGQRISGQVVDGSTGNAVPHAFVAYAAPLETNQDEFVWQPAEPTNERGEFEYYVKPGKVKLRAVSPDRMQVSRPSEVLEVSRDTPLKQLKLMLNEQNKAVFQGRVLDPAGRPLEGVSVAFGRISGRGQYDLETKSKRNGCFALPITSDYADLSQCELILVHDQLHLGAIFPLIELDGKQPMNKPLEIKLIPLATLTGRVIDPDGKPFRDAIVVLDVQIETKRMNDGVLSSIIQPVQFYHAETLTDKQGYYTIENVLPGEGLKYSVSISATGYAYAFGKGVTVESGKKQDLGTIRMVPATESISGIVVDDNGKPVANIQIYASPVRTGEETSYSCNCGIIVTKEDGKFTLNGLTKGKLEIYPEVLHPGKDQPTTQPMRKPNQVVESGQQNIRVEVEMNK